MAETNGGNFPYMKPKVCILRSDGTNCDEELAYAFVKFGAEAEFIQINELRTRSKNLENFQILALPGGFSYGDDLASGKVLAVELIEFFKNDLLEFLKNKGIIIGICNGFQTLVRTGLLPYNNLGKMDITLAQNQNGRFECRWVKVKTEYSKCKFLPPNLIMDIAVNHGEGKFYADTKLVEKIESDNLVIARYVDAKGSQTQQYPDNPNGSINAIAGITDPTGRIIGMMPHPEKFVDITQHPNWRRQKFLPAGRQVVEPHGAIFFENLIKFVKSQ